MMWKSLKEQLPPIDTYILLCDGKQVYPHFTNDLAIFVTEGKDNIPAIVLPHGQKIKVSQFHYWSLMPDPIHVCDHCDACSPIISHETAL